MGVVDKGCCEEQELAGLAEGVDWETEGRKEIDSVPENRTIETAKATGRTAVRGLGQFKIIFVSIPNVIRSLKSTSMRACSRAVSASVDPSSTGWTRQLLNMGKSSPKLISVTFMLERKSGFWGPLRTVVRDVKMASSWWASVRNWAIV